MRLTSSTSWEGIFTTIKNLLHIFMFYILKSTYLYRSRGYFFLNNNFFVKVVSVTPHKFELSKMDLKNEQISTMKFCCWLKKSAVETAKLMHKAYTHKEWLRDLTIFHWHKAFPKGKEITVFFPHAGQPLSICITEMVNVVTTVVRKDRHITVQQLAWPLDISKLSVHTILCEKLKIWRVTACWVSHFLTREQRDHCIEICCEWLKTTEDAMGHVITGDESRIQYFDPATKQESMHWKSPQSPIKKKVHQAKSMNKVILILFCDGWGAIHHYTVSRFEHTYIPWRDNTIRIA